MKLTNNASGPRYPQAWNLVPYAARPVPSATSLVCRSNTRSESAAHSLSPVINEKTSSLNCSAVRKSVQKNWKANHHYTYIISKDYLLYLSDKLLRNKLQLFNRSFDLIWNLLSVRESSDCYKWLLISIYNFSKLFCK